MRARASLDDYDYHGQLIFQVVASTLSFLNTGFESRTSGPTKH